MTGTRQLESTVTGVGNRAIRLCNLKKSIAGHREVKRVFGGDDAALRMNLFRGHHAHSGSHHQARGRLSIRRGANLATWNTDLLVQQILERRAVALETGGIDVGEIVGNRRHAHLLRV